MMMESAFVYRHKQTSAKTRCRLTVGISPPSCLAHTLLDMDRLSSISVYGQAMKTFNALSIQICKYTARWVLVYPLSQ